jgi:hypothetical protein
MPPDTAGAENLIHVVDLQITGTGEVADESA